MILTKKQFLEEEDFYVDEIKKGKIFIYPTDTIYGIGCDASNGEAIKKIREIKKREGRPFSVIVPSKKWILENCEVNEEKYVDRLPGKYTLILRLKKKTDLAKEELVGGADTLGVRIPKHWFSEVLSRYKLIFVTTSLNISGEKPITCVSELSEDILNQIDYAIDDGVLDGHPSSLIDMTKEKVEIIER